jgi:fructose-bisphosphate aldolase class 1
MNMQDLNTIAAAIVAPGKGILAADESSGTIEKRFRSIDVASTEEHRRAYRELLFATEGAGEFIGGVILFDETIRQGAADGTPFPVLLDRQGIIPGIKVDKGAKELAGFPGEKVTEGLDGLRERLASYRDLGAKFTKWRAVITIGDGIPTRTCIDANAEALARCLRDNVPASVPGIVFLSGGQSDEVATAHLNAMNRLGPQPWQLSFSYGRALQAPALKAWKGEPANGPAAQKAYYHRAKLNGAARFGRYTEEMEATGS